VVRQGKTDLVVQVRILRLKFQRAAVRSDSLGEFAPSAIRRAEISVIMGRVWFLANGPRKVFHGLLVVARLVRDQAKTVQRVGLVGRVPEDLSIDPLGLSKPARLVMLGGNLQSFGNCHDPPAPRGKVFAVHCLRSKTPQDAQPEHRHQEGVNALDLLVAGIQVAYLVSYIFFRDLEHSQEGWSQSRNGFKMIRTTLLVLFLGHVLSDEVFGAIEVECLGDFLQVG
jgi:hypothetical protein